MAHIRRHPNNPKTWQARYIDPNGKEQSKTFKRKVDAEQYRIKMEAAMQRGEWIDPDLGKCRIAEFVEDMEARRVSGRATTRARDTSYFRSLILPYFGSRQLRSVERSDVQDWINALSERSYAPGTIRKAYQLLARVFNEAVDRSYLVRTPCRNIALPPLSRTEIRLLDTDEVDALADAVPDQYRALVLSAAYTGLRWGELAGLQRRSVDLLRRTITVRQSLAEVQGHLQLAETKTAASRRKVTLPRFLAVELDHHLSTHLPGRDNFVFTAPDGGPMRRTNFRRRIWIPAVAASVGQPCRFHDLRHTHAALLIRQGEHPKVIQSRLGHASISTTLDTYGHLFDGMDQGAADRLDDLVSTISDGHLTDNRPLEAQLVRL